MSGSASDTAWVASRQNRSSRSSTNKLVPIIQRQGAKPAE
jgi:hypothetical protein